MWVDWLLTAQDVNEFGIVQGHAYGILDVKEETDQHGTHRLIEVRVVRRYCARTLR